MRAPRIFGVMVVRNEAHRYLREAVASLRLVVDGLLVYDDDSEDGSGDIAREEGATVVQRVGGPSWMEHEGKFRENAWRSLNRLGVDLGDWVISVDADEFIVTKEPDRRQAMLTSVQVADEAGFYALRLRIHEVFGWQDGTAMVRTDGFWGDLKTPRMMRWGITVKFPDRSMGSGSIPGVNHRMATADLFEVVHLGYAREEDRRAKFERYQGLPGHNPKHIASILQKPKLTALDVDLPCGPS